MESSAPAPRAGLGLRGPFACSLLAAILVLHAIAVLPTRAADAPQGADAAFASAREHLQKGRYAEALEAYDALAKAGADPVRVALGRSRALLAEGQTAKAAEILSAARTAHPQDAALAAESAHVAFRRGLTAEAAKSVAQALEIDPDQPLARLVQADLYAESGRVTEANVEYRWFVRFYNRRQPKDADSLLLVARGAAQYARWNSVGQIFDFVVNTLAPDALKADPLAWETNLITGRLLLEKYNRAQALPELRGALAINPRATDVHAAIGESALQQYDLPAAEASAKQALEIDPRHVPSLQLLADVRIAQSRLAEAVETLESALKSRPGDQKTLGRLAACRLLQSTAPDVERVTALLGSVGSEKPLAPREADPFERIVLDVVGRSPRPGWFLAALGAALESRRKYDLAEPAYRAAIRVMPQLAEPKTALGLLSMRVGQLGEARRILDDAFKADPYHVRVSNTRKVLSVLEGYETIATEHFVVHFDPQDRLLGRYMSEYLEEVHAELAQEYGFSPPHRTHFEIYHDAKGIGAHQWFSARMVGLPWIQTIGASTGAIVAMASPNAVGKPFHWGRVAKHEYVHVVTLQQTRYNIPHWFTEALAVTSEDAERPDVWNELLRERVPAGELRTLDELNEAFIRPKTPLDWQFAYCQSRLYAQYMTETFGKDSLRKMLDCYRQNLSTADAVRRTFGREPEEFDRGYRQFLVRLVESLEGGPIEPERTLAELEKAHLADPADLAAAGRYADGLLDAGRKEDARRLAKTVVAKQPAQTHAALVLATLAAEDEDEEAGVRFLEPALDRQKPHPDVLLRLAKLKVALEKRTEAVELFDLGRKAFPSDVDFLKGRIALALGSEGPDVLVPLLKHLVRFETDDVAARKKLADLLVAQKSYDEAAKYAREALFVDVRDVVAHRLLGEAELGRKRFGPAIREFETALELKADDDESEFGLARALVAAERSADAKRTLARLLDRKPDHAEARSLLEKL